MSSATSESSGRAPFPDLINDVGEECAESIFHEKTLVDSSNPGEVQASGVRGCRPRYRVVRRASSRPFLPFYKLSQSRTRNRRSNLLAELRSNDTRKLLRLNCTQTEPPNFRKPNCHSYKLVLCIGFSVILAGFARWGGGDVLRAGRQFRQVFERALLGRSGHVEGKAAERTPRTEHAGHLRAGLVGDISGTVRELATRSSRSFVLRRAINWP